MDRHLDRTTLQFVTRIRHFLISPKTCWSAIWNFHFGAIFCGQVPNMASPALPSSLVLHEAKTSSYLQDVLTSGTCPLQSTFHTALREFSKSGLHLPIPYHVPVLLFMADISRSSHWSFSWLPCLFLSVIFIWSILNKSSKFIHQPSDPQRYLLWSLPFPC